MSTASSTLPPRPSVIGASGASPAPKRSNSAAARAGTPTNMSRINSGNTIPRPSPSAGQTSNRQNTSTEERRGSTASSDLSASLNSPLTARPNRVASVTLKNVDPTPSDGGPDNKSGRNVGGNDTKNNSGDNFLGLNSDSMVASIRRGGEDGEELAPALSPISKAASVRGQQPAALGNRSLVFSATSGTVASASASAALSPSPQHKVDRNPHDFLTANDYSSLRPNTDTSLTTAPSYSATHKAARQSDETFTAYDNTTTTAQHNTESAAFDADAPWPETLHDRVLRARLAISDLFDQEYERSNYDKSSSSIQSGMAMMPTPQQMSNTVSSVGGPALSASRKASLVAPTRPASSSAVAVGLSEDGGGALVSGVSASVPNGLSIAQNKAHLKLLRSRVVHILHQLADSVRVDDAVSEGLEEVLRNSNISQTLIASSPRSAGGGGLGLGFGAGGSAHRLLLEGKSSSSRKGLDAGGSGGRVLLRPLTTGSERGLGVAGAGVANSARHDLIMANVRVKLSEKIREIEALKAFCKRKDSAIDSIRGALLQDVINLKKENIELTAQVANLQTALQRDQQTAGRAMRGAAGYVSSHKGDDRNGNVPLDAAVPATSYESIAPASASPASHGLGSPNMSTTFLTATATSAVFAGNVNNQSFSPAHTLQMQQTAAREYLTIFDYLRLFEGDDPDPERQEGGALRIAERHHREVVQRLNIDNTNQILLKDREIELLRREIDHLNGEVVSALNKKYVPANSYLMYRLALMRASRFGGKSGAAAMALAVQLGQNEVDATAKLSRERRRESTGGGAKETGEEESEDTHSKGGDSSSDTNVNNNNTKMDNLWDPVAKAPYGVVLPEGIVVEAVGPRTGEELENDLVFVMRELDKKIAENTLLTDRLEREKVEGSSRAANERASLLREQQAAQELTSQLEERETECAQLQETVATLQRALADVTNPNKRDEKGQIQKAAEMESVLRMNVELQSETIPRITKERDALASTMNELKATIEQLKADAALAAADAEGANDNSSSDLAKSGPQQLAALVKNNAVLSRQAQRMEQELKQSQQRLDDERQKVEALQNELNEARAEMALRGKTASGNNLLLLARKQSNLRRPSMQSDSAQTPTNGGGDKEASSALLSMQIAELEDQMQFLKEEKKEQEDEARRMAKKIELLEGHLRTASEAAVMGDGSDPSSAADNKGGARKGSDVKEMKSIVYSLQKENTDLHTAKMTLEQKTETLEAKNLDLLNEVQLLKTQLMLEKNRTAALTTPKPTETTLGHATSSSSSSTTTIAGKKGNGGKDRNKSTKPMGTGSATTVTTKRGATTITAPSPGRTGASTSATVGNSKGAAAQSSVSKKDLAVSDFDHQETLIEPPAGSVNTATSSSIRHASASQRERSAASGGGVVGNKKGRDVKVAEESEALLSEEGRKASMRGEGSSLLTSRSSPSARGAVSSGEAALRGGGDGVDAADDDLTYYATIRNEDGGAGFEDEDEDEEFDDFEGIGGRPSSRGLGHKGSPRGGVGVRSRLGGSGTRMQTHDSNSNNNCNVGAGGFHGTYFYGEEIPASAYAGFVGISSSGPLSSRHTSALTAGKVGIGGNSSNTNNKAVLAGGMAARPLSSSNASLLSHPSSQLTSGRKVAGSNNVMSLSSASLKSGTIAKTALPEVTAVLGECGEAEEISNNNQIQGKAKDSSSSDAAQIIKTHTNPSSSALLVGDSGVTVGSASVQIATPVGGFGGDGGIGTPAITAMGRPQSAAGLLSAAGGGGASSDRKQEHLVEEGGGTAAKKSPTAVDLLSGLPPPRVASASSASSVNRLRGGISMQKNLLGSRPPSPSATTVAVESRRSVLGEKDGDLLVTKDKHHHTLLGSASSSGNKNKRLPLPPSSAGEERRSENGKTTSTVLYQGFAPMAARDISSMPSSAQRRLAKEQHTGDTAPGETHGLHSSTTAVVVGGGLPPLSSHSLLTLNDESSSQQLPHLRELADTSTQTDFSLFVNESGAVAAEPPRGQTTAPLNNTLYNAGIKKSGGGSAGSLEASNTSTNNNNRSAAASQQRLSHLIAPPNFHLSPPQPSDLHPRYTVASRFGALHHKQSGLGVYGPSSLSSSPSRMVRDDVEGADDVEGSHAPKRERRPSPVASSFASASALAPPPQAGGLFISEAEAAEAVDSVFAPSSVLQKYWALQWIRQHSDQFVRHYQYIIYQQQQQNEQQQYHEADIRYIQSGQQRAAAAGGGVSQPNAKPRLGDSDVKKNQQSKSSASFLASSASYLTKTDKKRAAQSFQWLGKEEEAKTEGKTHQNDDTLQRQKEPSLAAGDTPADPKKESHFYEPDGAANHTSLPAVSTARPKYGDDPSVELASSNAATTCSEGNVATPQRPLAESISKIEQRHGGGARCSSASSRPTSRPSSAAGPNSATSAPLVFPPSAHVQTTSGGGGGSGASSPTAMSRPTSAASGGKPLAVDTNSKADSGIGVVQSSVSQSGKDQQRRDIDSTVIGNATNPSANSDSTSNIANPTKGEDTTAAATKPNWRTVVRNAEIECQKAEIELDEHLRTVGRERQAKQLAAMVASRSRSPTKRFDSTVLSGSGTNAAERAQGSSYVDQNSPSSSSPPSLSGNIPFRNALAFGPSHANGPPSSAKYDGGGDSSRAPQRHGALSPEASSINASSLAAKRVDTGNTPVAPLPFSGVVAPQAGTHAPSSFSFSTSNRAVNNSGISRGCGGGASSALDIRMLTKDIYHVDDLLPEDAALERRIAASAAVRRTRGASGAGDGDPNGGGTAGRKQRQAAGGATASVRGVREKVQAQINVAKFMQTFPDLHPLPRQSPNSHAPVKPPRK